MSASPIAPRHVYDTRYLTWPSPSTLAHVNLRAGLLLEVGVSLAERIKCQVHVLAALSMIELHLERSF